MIKLTLVSIRRGTVRKSFFLPCLYRDEKAVISLEQYGEVIRKSGFPDGAQISFCT